MDEYLDITPNWKGVYRYLMNIKKTNPNHYHHLIKVDNGEITKLINLAEKKGWNKETK